MTGVRLFIGLAAFGVAHPWTHAAAQDKKETWPDEKPAPSLKVGDPAPALKVSKWLQGESVTRFEPGKVYVVEFWAASCGALHGFMPYLDQLQARYKDQGVTIVSFTSLGLRGWSGNTETDVAAFLEAQRPRLGHAFAYADDGAMADAWLTAAGQKGFCTFVVDKAGRIAYMGHPMFLGIVLPKVVAGDASARAVGREAAQVVAEYVTIDERLVRDFQAGRDVKPGLRAVQALEAKYPPLADLLPIIRARLSLLPKHGDPGEAKAYAEAVVAKATAQNDIVVLELAYSILRNEKESHDLLAVALKAADARVRIDGGKNARSLLHLADAYRASGDKAKAREYAHRAIEVAAGEPPAFRQQIQQEAKPLAAEN